jgi:hypothetical protein
MSMPKVEEYVEKAAEYERRASAEADASRRRRYVDAARWYRLLAFDVMQAEATSLRNAY